MLFDLLLEMYTEILGISLSKKNIKCPGNDRLTYFFKNHLLSEGDKYGHFKGK